MNPFTQSFGECVSHPLVATFDPEQLLAEQRSAAKLLDGCHPNRIEGRSRAAREPNGGRRGTVTLQKLRSAHLVEMIESDTEWLPFILKMAYVRLKIEQGKIPPGVLGQVIGLALIESEAIQYSTGLEILRGVPVPIDEAQHVIATRIRHHRQFEFFQVLPILPVNRLVEVFSTSIRIEPVGERVMHCSHMPAGPSRGLEHYYLMPSFHQLIGARKTGNSRARDNHSLPETCRRGRRARTAPDHPRHQRYTGYFQGLSSINRCTHTGLLYSGNSNPRDIS